MHSPPLADDLRRFIRSHVTSMDCADVLVQLMRAAPAARTATEVAAAATLPATRVEALVREIYDATHQD